MLQQAHDFSDESDATFELLKNLPEADFEKATLFKQWTINDILIHLHYFNWLADLSLREEDQFFQEYGKLGTLMQDGVTLRQAAADLLDNPSGHALLTLWRDYYTDMTEHFAAADPKKRVKWAGPDMSVLSAISARLMETWSHSQAIYDLLGVERVNHDRIKNIAIMGINTFDWTFINRGEEVPDEAPYIRLAAPSGEVWEWNEPGTANAVDGDAAEFCQVVTQSRNIADTGLKVAGDTATRWMAWAQCFAGPPETPPAAGVRHR